MKKYLSVLLLLFAFVFSFNATCNAQMIWENTQYPVSSDAGAWNGVYERKDLLAEFTLDQLSAKIAAGDFSGISIGSYIETDIKPSVDGAVLALSGNSTSGTTAYDVSGNANNATMSGVTLSSDTDKAFIFNGSAYIDANPNITSNKATFACKIKTTSSNVSVIDNRAHSGNIEVAWINSNGTLQSGVSSQFMSSNKIINDNEWHDICLVVDNQNLQLYIDGLFETEISVNTSPVINTSYIIGSYNYSGLNAFNGTMKGIKIYPRALSAEEMLQLHNATQDEGLTERVRWLVAGLDHFLHSGSTPINDHHLLMVAEDCLKNTTKMNDTNTTAGGYFGSYFYTAIRAHLGQKPNLYNPSNSIFLTTSVDTTLPSMAGAGFTGASNGCSWKFIGTQLMSEVELYGTTVLSSSFYDVGNSRTQFPLFRLKPDLIHANKGIDKSAGGRQTYWLRAVADSSDFCIAQYQGVASRSNASLVQGIRPFFLFK